MLPPNGWRGDRGASLFGHRYGEATLGDSVERVCSTVIKTSQTEFDGSTPRLSVDVPLPNAATEHTLTIVICDAGDGAFDTAIMHGYRKIASLPLSAGLNRSHPSLISS